MLLENEKLARVNGFAGASPSGEGTGSEAGITLSQVLRRHATRLPHHPAIVSAAFAPLTYHDLQRQLDEIRRQLRQAGFDCNSRIGVLMPNGPEAVLAIVAVACCCIAVPLDPRLTPAEIDDRLDLLRLKALLVPQGSASAARQSAERRRLAVIEAASAGHGRLGLDIAVQAGGSPVVDVEPDPRSPAFILPTSGTTAQPKLIPFSHANMLAAADRLRAWFDLTPSDRCLSVSPPYYSHGLKVTVFTPLLTGGSIAVPANASVLALDEWFELLRPTWYSAGPTLHNAVLDKARGFADAQAAHTLRFIVSGGAPLPKDVRDDLQRILGVPVLEHYGSSEAAQMAANRPPPGPNRPGTCGQAWPGTLAVVGEGGRPLPAGEHGEVWVRGPTVMSGYLEAPALNEAAFSNGWFRTGDIGSLDQDGFLSLHGRLGELINRGGEKISPADIDAALLRHPAVAEAAAFAIPHPRLGEDVAAAIVPHPGAQTTPAELRGFLQRELASFKIPHRILILDELPKGTTGKVQRRRLREIHGAPSNHPAAQPPPDGRKEPSDLETELLTLWRRLLKSEAVTADDDFFESGGDSLLATEMLIEVERLIGHLVPETILFGAETIRQLVPRLTMLAATPATPFFQSHPDGDRPPLFFFHGDFVSGGLEARRLVELFGRGYPIITIDPHGLRGEPVPPSIAKMAADRLPLILEKQASGPYLLGGKCNGGLVAFETARLLMAAGHRVELVAIIDPPGISARPASRAMLELMQPLVAPRRLGWAYEQMARLERFLKMQSRERLAKMHNALFKAKKRPPSSLLEVYSIAMAQYRPEPLNVPAVFYSAGHDGQAWRRLSPQLEVIQVPGSHLGCLTVGVEPLVDHLRHRIDALADGASLSSSRAR